MWYLPIYMSHPVHFLQQVSSEMVFLFCDSVTDDVEFEVNYILYTISKKK